MQSSSELLPLLKALHLNYSRMDVLNPALLVLEKETWMYSRISAFSPSETFEGEVCPQWDPTALFQPVPCNTIARLKSISLNVRCRVGPEFKCL